MHDIDCLHLQLLIVLICLHLAEVEEIVLVGLHLNDLQEVFHFHILGIRGHRDAAISSKYSTTIHALTWINYSFALFDQCFTRDSVAEVWLAIQAIRGHLKVVLYRLFPFEGLVFHLFCNLPYGSVYVF